MAHLLYCEPTLGEAISWFGGALKPSSPSSVTTNPAITTGKAHIHLTVAPLKDIVQAEIYSDDVGASTGVLFKYADGTLECLGQRRVGLSTTEVTRVEYPTWLCSRHFEILTHDHRGLPRKRKGVELHFSTKECEIHLSNEEWCSQRMAGKLFWAFKSRCDGIWVKPIQE
jgi:hypothetical protein